MKYHELLNQQTEEEHAYCLYDMACATVLESCKDEYAKAYAKVGIGMREKAAAIQSLRILNKLKYWEGDVAADTKRILLCIAVWKGE